MRSAAGLYATPLLKTDQPAIDTAANVQAAAVEGHTHIVDWVAWSYDAAPSDAGTIMEVSDPGGAAVVYSIPARSAGVQFVSWRDGFTAFTENTLLSVALTAAGAAVTGRLNVGYRTVKKLDHPTMAVQKYYNKVTAGAQSKTLAAAEGVYHKINWIHCGYAAAPTGGDLVVTKGGTTVLSIDIIGTNPQFLDNLNIVSDDNEALAVTMADGSQTSYLNFGYE
jgi:hypothetical protein